jgi:hypothetical protein
MSITKYLTLALAVAVAACESPAGPVVGPDGPQFAAVGQQVNTTRITINSASLTAGQTGEIVAQLWWAEASHPLGGKDMSLYIDGTLIDSKHGSKLGTATFSAPGLVGGTHTIKVSFDGDKNFVGSETTITITIG